MRKYLDWAAHEYSLRRRMVVLGFLAPLFLGLFPFLIVRGAARLDRRLHLPRFRAGAVNRVAGAGLGPAGGFLGLADALPRRGAHRAGGIRW